MEQSVATGRWDVEAMDIPWVESPFFETLLEQSDLDEEQRRLARQYSEKGYVIIDTEIPDAVIEGVIEGLRGKHGQARPSYGSRIQDADVPQVRQIAGWTKVTDVLRMLYRREPFPFQTLNFEVGTQQPVHNDAIHFHAVPHRFMCGVWIALEDTDAENGPLFYYPGSHKLPIYEMPDFGLATSTESYGEWGQAVEALLRAGGFELEELHVKRGQALIWAANLHHGGRPVLDATRTRHSQVNHYFFEPGVLLLAARHGPGQGAAAPARRLRPAYGRDGSPRLSRRGDPSADQAGHHCGPVPQTAAPFAGLASTVETSPDESARPRTVTPSLAVQNGPTAKPLTHGRIDQARLFPPSPTIFANSLSAARVSETTGPADPAPRRSPPAARATSGRCRGGARCRHG